MRLWTARQLRRWECVGGRSVGGIDRWEIRDVEPRRANGSCVDGKCPNTAGPPGLHVRPWSSPGLHTHVDPRGVSAVEACDFLHPTDLSDRQRSPPDDTTGAGGRALIAMRGDREPSSPRPGDLRACHSDLRDAGVGASAAARGLGDRRTPRGRGAGRPRHRVQRARGADRAEHLSGLRHHRVGRPPAGCRRSRRCLGRRLRRHGPRTGRRDRADDSAFHGPRAA